MPCFGDQPRNRRQPAAESETGVERTLGRPGSSPGLRRLPSECPCAPRGRVPTLVRDQVRPSEQWRWGNKFLGTKWLRIGWCQEMCGVSVLTELFL